ncbi:MFS transporter [Gemmata sp. JC717]|uniref:MFS transporter n=1 Tax=Gemmata algarum TaxID=2975278 RepID=A0ABU5EWW1_9BACT|nr:MFS transporter [Gemmata algarum]MDY3554706.1 MFS transporter [Gemmata algarum]MDY3559666.1 MFS transporter [Gemmata algarum]
MSLPAPGADGLPSLSPVTRWLVLAVAAIGFLFDTYELLMLPLIGAPAIAELLGVPPNNPQVREWLGYILWAAAVCGGVFGLAGGLLIDRFGRKRIMILSILLYSFSPVAAAFSTSVWMFALFRCTTFIGVCVEFVAAITWLAELFEDKRTRELAIGWTQAFASVGGLVVTGANTLARTYADRLPAIPVPEPFDSHAFWRYTLLTGLVPGVLILLLMPFVPESRVWLARKRAGTLRRPRFAELFSPELRRVTLVSTALSACAYAAAFGALQLTPTQVVPGLPSLVEQQKQLKPLREEATELNSQLNETQAKLRAQFASVAGLEDVVNARSVAQRDLRKARERIEAAKKAEQQPPADAEPQVQAAQAKLKELTGRLNEVTKEHTEARQLVLDREATLQKLGANRGKQAEPDQQIRDKGDLMQFWQEMGGLVGRILLAALLVVILNRRVLLRVFQVPGLVAFPLTYYFLFRDQPDLFAFGVFVCGLCTVSQFSYLGEYLPKAFPVHLRGTGGSFATNVGGRMVGTSASFVTTSLVAPLVTGGTFVQVATGAAIVGTVVYLLGVLLSFALPTPKEEGHVSPSQPGAAAPEKSV